MNMPTCTRRLQFCAGHRVMGHENKCAHLHGHNYVVFLTATQDPNSRGDSPWTPSGLDNIGRVIDFSVLKEKVGGWIDEHWDHGFIVYKEDTKVLDLLVDFARGNHNRQKIFRIPNNPTAENMALYLLFTVGPEVLKDTGVKLSSVRVWETENCYADASID